MLSKKRVFFIAIFFLFVTFFPKLKNVNAGYSCNQDCSRNTSACNSPLTCVSGLCRNPSCTGETDCTCAPGPTNLAQSCGAGGTTSNFSWTGVAGYNNYILRINEDPAGDWMGPGDQWICITGTSATANITAGAPYSDWSVQTTNPGCTDRDGIQGAAGFTCAPPVARVWNMTAHPVCANGVVPQNIQAGWTIWPPDPLVWSNDSFATGDHVISINSSLDLNGAAYLRLQDTAGTYLPATSASNPNINVGTFFGQPGANWQRSVLPEGSYTVNYTAPAVDCPVPTCSISANPASIAYNTASNITWSSTNATSCSISPPGWTGTSGSQSTGSLTSTTTYTCNCRGSGGSGTDSTTVTVVPPPVTPTLSCTAFTNPAQITWDWTISPGPVTYWLQVWGDVWKINEAGIAGPTVTTTATPGSAYYGHVLASDGNQSSAWSNPPTASLTTCTVPLPTAPALSCGSFNQAGVYTPVTATWANGTNLQVTRDLAPGTNPPAADWLYNAAASSPKTVTPSAGKYMPPGHIIYARTTYDSSTFSTTSSITCPVPTNPDPATVQGPLQQKSGTGCIQANATDNFNVQNPTATTNPSSCVDTSCTVSPNNNTARTYTCTTTFSSNNCLDDSPPTWPTSATVTLTGIAPPGYTLVGWTPNGSCTPPNNSQTVNAGGTTANQPLTFDFSGANWIKLKSSSFNRVSIPGITVPAVITNYDSNDDGSKYFISGVGGSVLNTTVSPNSDPLSLHYSNPNNWHDSSYSAGSLSMSPSAFLGYVKSRKGYTPIDALNKITADGIYVYQGDLTLTNTNLALANATKFVLIVDGNVTIDQDKFNIVNCTDASGLKKIAILSKTGTITFSGTTQCAAGIFIASTVDTGSNANQGLKIIGNLIAQSTFTNGRSWPDTSRPGLFIVFDPVQYINLLPYLSIANYEWTQIQ